jgi:hypothetical protein
MLSFIGVMVADKCNSIFRTVDPHFGQEIRGRAWPVLSPVFPSHTPCRTPVRSNQRPRSQSTSARIKANIRLAARYGVSLPSQLLNGLDSSISSPQAGHLSTLPCIALLHTGHSFRIRTSSPFTRVGRDCINSPAEPQCVRFDMSRQSEKFLIGHNRKFLLTAERLKTGTDCDDDLPGRALYRFRRATGAERGIRIC